MKPLFQTPGDNQCLRHAVASIFELPIEEVPFFGGALAFDEEARKDGSYGSLQEREFRMWLRERGLDYHKLYNLPLSEGRKPWYYNHDGAFAGLGLAMGPTERGTYHAVVWRHSLWDEGKLPGEEELRERIGSIGVLAHDPHPSGAGLLHVEEFLQFIIIDPGAFARWVWLRAVDVASVVSHRIGDCAGPKTGEMVKNDIVRALEAEAGGGG